MKTPNRKYWIFLADTQLGAVPENSTEREEDYYKAFQNQCKIAAEDKLCLGIIGGGDLREKPSLQARNMDGFTKGLEILQKSEKNLLAIMGNHDYTVPCWIEALRHPALKNLTNSKVQEEAGFNPKKTLVLHAQKRTQLHVKLKESERWLNKKLEEIEIVFLHQAITEFTTSIYHSGEINMKELVSYGLGSGKQCKGFIGDIHNYGDAKEKNLEIIYPGSLEMTDANEGVNGLRSERYEVWKNDWRKFVVHIEEGTFNWKRVEVNPRPWFYLFAKTKKEADKGIEELIKEIGTWEEKGIVSLTLPEKEIQYAAEMLDKEKDKILRRKVREYNAKVENWSSEEETEDEISLSSQEIKEFTMELACKEKEEGKISKRAVELIEKIIEKDGSSLNTKAEVAAAWEEWKKNEAN